MTAAIGTTHAGAAKMPARRLLKETLIVFSYCRRGHPLELSIYYK
jgi:hypothetical protein